MDQQQTDLLQKFHFLNWHYDYTTGYTTLPKELDLTQMPVLEEWIKDVVSGLYVGKVGADLVQIQPAWRGKGWIATMNMVYKLGQLKKFAPLDKNTFHPTHWKGYSRIGLLPDGKALHNHF